MPRAGNSRRRRVAASPSPAAARVRYLQYQHADMSAIVQSVCAILEQRGLHNHGACQDVVSAITKEGMSTVDNVLAQFVQHLQVQAIRHLRAPALSYVSRAFSFWVNCGVLAIALVCRIHLYCAPRSAVPMTCYCERALRFFWVFAVVWFGLPLLYVTHLASDWYGLTMVFIIAWCWIFDGDSSFPTMTTTFRLRRFLLQAGPALIVIPFLCGTMIQCPPGTKCNALANSMTAMKGPPVPPTTNLGNLSSIAKTLFQSDDQEIALEDCKTFYPPVTSGRVVKVYDGDTITIATRLMQFSGDTIFKFPVRLSGIDTPELRTKNDDERKAALIVRDALADLILQKDVTLSHVTYDKYGRLLADVRFGEIHLSHWLIENRFAVEYFGKTKMSPQSWTAFMSG